MPKVAICVWRIWDEEKGVVMFIGLNPSTADEETDDPTIRRCINYAKAWGNGGICMLNIFAYRATDPKEMKMAQNPIGPENDNYLKEFYKDAKIVIACWGNHGLYKNRGEQVINLLDKLHCLGITNNEQPKHPLYLKADLKPREF